jgi:hypothetical protein
MTLVTAGYSGTPQSRKLGIKPGYRVGLDGAPPGWRLTDPPADVEFVDVTEQADVIVAFVSTVLDLGTRLPGLAPLIWPDRTLWIAWPRRAGGHVSDVNGDVVRASVLALGLVDVKVAAIDQDWSGQKVVWRVANRVTPPAR